MHVFLKTKLKIRATTTTTTTTSNSGDGLYALSVRANKKKKKIYKIKNLRIDHFLLLNCDYTSVAPIVSIDANITRLKV